MIPDVTEGWDYAPPVPAYCEGKFSITPGCWEWTAHIDPQGYGRVNLPRKMRTAAGGCRLAHRVMYESLVGPIPHGLCLDHLCRNRRCVNPSHLEPVTVAENNRRASLALTHCKAGGHEFTPENTRWTRNPRAATGFTRSCKACNRERVRLAKEARSQVACKNGHPRTPEHASVRTNGAFFCLSCVHDRYGKAEAA